jgi:hypothetical protein
MVFYRFLTNENNKFQFLTLFLNSCKMVDAPGHFKISYCYQKFKSFLAEKILKMSKDKMTFNF